MNPSRTAAIVVGVNLIAVWVAAAAGGLVTQPSAGSVPATVTADRAVGEASSLLTAATVRLETHAVRRVITAPVARDPFRFGGAGDLPARRDADVRGAHRAAEAEPTGTEAQEPPFDVVLQGMAEFQDGDAVVRTAILKTGGELVLATLGMSIGSRFQVVAIAAESVVLEDTRDQSRRTYRMQ